MWPLRLFTERLVHTWMVTVQRPGHQRNCLAQCIFNSTTHNSKTVNAVNFEFSDRFHCQRHPILFDSCVIGECKNRFMFCVFKEFGGLRSVWKYQCFFPASGAYALGRWLNVQCDICVHVRWAKCILYFSFIYIYTLAENEGHKQPYKLYRSARPAAELICLGNRSMSCLCQPHF